MGDAWEELKALVADSEARAIAAEAELARLRSASPTEVPTFRRLARNAVAGFVSDDPADQYERAIVTVQAACREAYLRGVRRGAVHESDVDNRTESALAADDRAGRFTRAKQAWERITGEPCTATLPELDSPPFRPAALDELEARGFARINRDAGTASDGSPPGVYECPRCTTRMIPGEETEALSDFIERRAAILVEQRTSEPQPDDAPSAELEARVASWRARILRTYPDRSAHEMRISEDAFCVGWGEARRRSEAAKPNETNVEDEGKT